MSSYPTSAERKVESPYTQYESDGHYLSGHVFQRRRLGTILSCGLACSNLPRCISVNYHLTQGVCELNDESVTVNQNIQLYNDSDYIYLDIKSDYNEANLYQRGCSSGPCLNGGHCSDAHIESCSVPNDYLLYICNCPEGTRGLNCDIVIEYNEVAEGKTAHQINTAWRWNGYAKNAIDGNTYQWFNYPNTSCTHTNKTVNPWWMVDLQDVYIIKWVNITNRMHSANKINNRILDSELHIGLSTTIKENRQCGETIDVFNITYLFDCQRMLGRYVGVQKFSETETVMSLCEVQVYADITGTCSTIHYQLTPSSNVNGYS
ncbi:uncharacterized protein LOC144342590 [Saccoglossus kowalevskii]